MDTLGTILFLAGLLCLPILLGRLASGKRTLHKGSTSCASCMYDLSGHDISRLHVTGKCPECGCTLSENSVFLKGALYYRPPNLWVAVSCIALLLVPPALIMWAVLGFILRLGWDFAGLLMMIAYPLIVTFAVRTSQEQSRQNSVSLGAQLMPEPDDAPPDPIRATMHIANYLENHPPSPPPPA